MKNQTQNKPAADSILQVVSAELSDFFEDNAPGYQHWIFITVRFRGTDYNLNFQPSEPGYLDGDFMLRERDGYTTGGWGLHAAETEDDSGVLAAALVKAGIATGDNDERLYDVWDADELIEAATAGVIEPIIKTAEAVARESARQAAGAETDE